MVNFDDFELHVRGCGFCELIGDRYELCDLGEHILLQWSRDGGILDSDGNVMGNNGSVLMPQYRRLGAR